ncbi:MAG: hypothetical protein V1909_03900 [Candidatus Micrarchaeota archaeon]
MIAKKAMKKLSRKDKLYLAQLSVSNRDFLSTLQTFIFSMGLAIASLLISLWVVFLSRDFPDKGSSLPILGMLAFIIVALFLVNRWLSPRIQIMNEQYQELLFGVYPFLKDPKSGFKY